MHKKKNIKIKTLVTYIHKKLILNNGSIRSS